MTSANSPTEPTRQALLLHCVSRKKRRLKQIPRNVVEEVDPLGSGSAQMRIWVSVWTVGPRPLPPIPVPRVIGEGRGEEKKKGRGNAWGPKGSFREDISSQLAAEFPTSFDNTAVEETQQVRLAKL